MQEVLDLKVAQAHPVTAASHGSKLVSADFHGAEIEVVKSRCSGRVGLKGIVVRDTKFTFVVVTRGDEVKSEFLLFERDWFTDFLASYPQRTNCYPLLRPVTNASRCR